MSTPCIKWSDLEERVSENGIGRRALNGESASLLMLHVPAGTVAPEHRHSFEQFVHVLSGSGELTTDQGTHRILPGTVLHFVPNCGHSAVFDTEALLLEVNVIPRQDGT